MYLIQHSLVILLCWKGKLFFCIIHPKTYPSHFSGIEFVRRFKSSEKGSLPMLTSACPGTETHSHSLSSSFSLPPGWVCYAEKTHGSYILPHISTTKSPQQIMGSLVKNFFAQQLKKT